MYSSLGCHQILLYCCCERLTQLIPLGYWRTHCVKFCRLSLGVSVKSHITTTETSQQFIPNLKHRRTVSLWGKHRIILKNLKLSFKNKVQQNIHNLDTNSTRMLSAAALSLFYLIQQTECHLQSYLWGKSLICCLVVALG